MGMAESCCWILHDFMLNFFAIKTDPGVENEKMDVVSRLMDWFRCNGTAPADQ